MVDLQHVSNEQTAFLTRACQHHKLAHAYLFVAEDKNLALNTAYWLACYLNCQGTDKPDGTCNNCRRILAGDHPDVFLVDPEQRASLSIEQIRPLKAELAKSPVESGRRFFFIQDAEKLTNAAANALLNLLEEPVAPVVSILITNNADQVLPTIRSRTQQLTFKETGHGQGQQLLDYGLSQDEIAELGDHRKLDQQLKYFYQNLLTENDLAWLDAHLLANLKLKSQQNYVLIKLKILAEADLTTKPELAAQMLSALIRVDKMRLSNVSFRNCLDYLVLAWKKQV
jgi:DNA polymerase-3 subunit delta'